MHASNEYKPSSYNVGHISPVPVDLQKKIDTTLSKNVYFSTGTAPRRYILCLSFFNQL